MLTAGTAAMPAFAYEDRGAAPLRSFVMLDLNNGTYVGNVSVGYMYNAGVNNHRAHITFLDLATNFIRATYYSGPSLAAPSYPNNAKLHTTDSNIDFSSAATVAGNAGSSFTCTTCGPEDFVINQNHFSYSVRFRGILRPSITLNSFQVQIGTTAKERYKVWIDDKIVLDAWTSAASSTAMSGTYLFPLGNQYYDLVFDYWVDISGGGSSTTRRLLWRDTGSWIVVPSSRMFGFTEVASFSYAVTVSS